MGWLSSIAIAQNPNNNAGGINWKLTGNQATSSDFIGTTNNQNLVLKCNNITALEIAPNSESKFMGDVFLDKLKPVTPLPPNEVRIVTSDNNGKLTSLDRSGLVSAIYDPQIQCFLLPNNQLPSPIWSAIPGVLYTGVGCPASVGIGTDNPIAALDVRGAGFFQGLGVNTSPTINEMIKINNTTNRTGIALVNNHPASIPLKYGIKNTVNNPNTIAYSVTDQATNQDVFVVKGNGSVGIGTNNPLELFQLGNEFTFHSGGTKAISRNYYFDNSTQSSKRIKDGFVSTIRFNDLGSIDLLVGPTGLAGSTIDFTTMKGLHIGQNGNVGIGTFAPSAKLMVEAGNNAGLVVTTLHDVNYGYGIRSIVNLNLSKAFAVYNNQAQEESFVVLGNGNVYATRVRVTETPFPDYVFETDYKLLSLNELESYITTNKHLPNMPTAQQVETEGADLGEINRVLVEKVEELTLYILELNKRMEQLEVDNKLLKVKR